MLLCCFWLAPLLAIVALVLSWYRMVTIAEPAADFQLRLTRNASSAWVIGDWDSWKRPGVPMHRDGSGLLSAEIWLPSSCTRSKLAVAGVCCYRFKFLVVQGGSLPERRWLIDEGQPTDTDGNGNVNNVLCKHTAQLGGNISQRNPLQRPRMSSALPGSARKARAGAGGASMANPSGSCLMLTGTAFNGTPLAHVNAHEFWACCEACQHRRRCSAFNWRPEPLANNCVLFGPRHGEAVGNALSYAGLMQPPKAGATRAIGGGQDDAATAEVQMAPNKTPKKRGKRRKKRVKA